MNAYARFDVERLASGTSPELWTGSVRLAGREPPGEFRHVKWHLFSRARANPPPAPKNAQTVLVTSARPFEGKTYVARNLVASLALDNQNDVTLIDANFNNPGLPHAAATGAYNKGLLDAIADDNFNLGSAFLDCSRSNVHLLAGGRPRANVPEMLNSERMPSILRQLTAGSDSFVVVDGGAMLANSEASRLAQYCGHILFVVSEGKSRKSDIGSALMLLDQVAGPIDAESFSFVFNKKSN